MEAPNLPVFRIWKRQKNHRYLCCLAQMTSNKAHIGMCMVSKGHFITINISPEGAARGKGKGKSTESSCSPCLSSGAAHG